MEDVTKRDAHGGEGQGTATLVRAAPARPLGGVLRVVGAPSTPDVHRLSSGKCVVGAGAGCDLVIDEATVSRQHAELTLVPEGVQVTDLGSRNGTFYLGQRIEKITLAFGARIRVGGAAHVVLDADGDSLRGAQVFVGDAYRGMVGTSAAMRRLFATLVRLEGSLVTVLVQGESGVGKELIARALHEGSGVAAGPLVTVNCGALPRELVASELFGHRRGAFTGAHDSRKGAFESADGGTLFLDEIGELPLEVQPILLRALETGDVTPVGGEPKKVRVRVVAATNRDLAEEVHAGRFREDLFFRLAVIKLEVPPLRERVEDVGPIAQRFADALGIGALPPDVVEQLKARAWAGNVRELRNAVQSFAALGVLPDELRGRSGALELALSDLVEVEAPYADQKDALVDRFTRVYLQALIAHTGGNQTQAAKLAGLDRTYLGRLLAKYGLSRG